MAEFSDDPTVSVVLCTYTLEMYDHFREAADSVLDQTFDKVELVVVVDGSAEVFDRVTSEYGGRSDIVIYRNETNVGLLASRNRGAELASGDVVAFIDDDAVADERWLEELVAAYKEHDRYAVGGKMTAEWVAEKPCFLPEEFYWLVGVTHRGFAKGEGEVRNTFGSNISFRREVFHELGGFDTEIGGRRGDANLQGGETELTARLRETYGQGVWYVPAAEVAHKVFEYRTKYRWLADRAFWQGYSKRAMETLVPDSSDTEGMFLRYLLVDATPRRLRSLVRKPSSEAVGQFVMLYVLMAIVGVGYLYGFTKW